MSDHTTWERLLVAHRAAASGATGHLPRHQPTAAILACSDARVPPSVIFDQPAGTLFVVRIAGNTATPSALASLDYAVETLGVDLIIVLGHTSCGAVQAAVDGTCGGHLAPIVTPICELARSHPDVDPDRIAELNVINTIRELTNHAGPVGRAAAAGRLELRGAIHDLVSGQLTPLLPDNRPLSPVEAP